MASSVFEVMNSENVVHTERLETSGNVAEDQKTKLHLHFLWLRANTATAG